jgi:hypothetical protein
MIVPWEIVKCFYIFVSEYTVIINNFITYIKFKRT